MDKFLIAPLNSGLQSDQRPFLIPDDAFSTLNNAYIFRGRVRKRFGSTLMNGMIAANQAQLYSKLGLLVGTTDAGGNLAGNVPPAAWVVPTHVGQQFIIGTAIYTVFQAGAVQPMLQTVATPTATFSTTTGAFNFVGAPALTDVYYYPSNPVMGIATYNENATTNDATIAFDTQFAYQFDNVRWQRFGTVVFTGSDSDFFWSITARGTNANDRFLYVTNNVAADSINYWNSTTNAWVQYRPNLDAVPNLLFGGLLLAYFKNRLIVLNTLEGPNLGGVSSYPNRIRWSQACILNTINPITPATSFLVVQGANSGGFGDIPTTESITSISIIKDRLIVFCEESTWELVFTGNQVDPFKIQQINRELGVEAPFSTIVFDKVILGIGNVGIHACNGANVERIDQKIPYQVFQINALNDGQKRVAGIRDYYNELVYWIYPQAARNDRYPSKILLFNYRTGSWATSDDSMTALGYFQYQTTVTWAQLRQQWQQTLTAWGAANFQNQFRSILAGNQQGVMFVVQNEVTSNANALSITNIDYLVAFNMPTLTIINHNLRTGDFIYLDNIQGASSFLNGRIFEVDRRLDDNRVVISAANAGIQSYTGGGTVALVSNINIVTKQYSFYAQDMAYSYTHRVAFNVDRTVNGQIQVDFYVSSGDVEIIDDSHGTGALVSSGVLETTPFTTPNAPNNSETTQQRLWHYVYLQAEGEYIQYIMYFNNTQMLNPLISMRSDFQLNAVAFYAQKTRKI
jgi:hypothetical protein